MKSMIKAFVLVLLCALLLTVLSFWPTGDENYVIGPGLLTVRVYATDKATGEIKAEELNVDTFLGDRPVVDLLSNFYPGLPLFLSVDLEEFPSEEITFDISVSSGVYFSPLIGQDYPSQFKIQNHSEIYWDLMGWDHVDENGNSYADVAFSKEFDHVFTKIIIRCEGNIIGYALLHFDRIYSDEVASENDAIQGNMPLRSFWVEVLASASFSKVDGQYQNVSEQYVNECIEKACTE